MFHHLFLTVCADNISGIQVRTLTKERLVLSLEKQYPGDVGVLAAYFMNYIKLSPGEALMLVPMNLMHISQASALSAWPLQTMLFVPA